MRSKPFTTPWPAGRLFAAGCLLGALAFLILYGFSPLDVTWDGWLRGGYVEKEPDEASSAQFDVSDTRTLDQVVRWLMELGYVPSFCTACYREGRTGDRFMSLCKAGQIQNCCLPNALMTLKEYLEDYAAPETKAVGEAVIARQQDFVTNPKVKAIVAERLQKIAQGERDFRF